MRFIGLTLALLASSLGARAESVEDRVNALEARVKVLEAALQGQGKVAVGSLDGTYGANVNGGVMTLELSNGKAVVSMEIKEGTLDAKSKEGTYHVDGQSVTVDINKDPVTFEIDGNHLKSTKDGETIDLVKVTSPGGSPATPVNVDGTYQATLPNGNPITLTFDKGKVVSSSGKDTRAGTYEIVGQRVVVTADGKSESLTIDGTVLHGGTPDKAIDFTKTQ
jgi:hypothetical protein